MKVRFLLKKKAKGDKEGLIYIALYFRDEVELISTGQRIAQKDWNEKEQFPRQHLGSVAKSIKEVESRIDKAILRLQARESLVTPYAVKQEYLMFEAGRLNDQIGKDKKAKESQKSIKSLANEWIDKNLFRYENSTQKAVKESINQFLEFLNKSGRGGIERQELDTAVVTAYERYLQEKKKLADSTHGKRMKHLRWFLKTLNYDVTSIEIRTHKKEIIALTLDEIELLENYDVSQSSEQQKAKDLFLLGCYTGLRISDLKRINHTRIIDDKICMILQKNKREVTIPITPKARVILERYGMKSPCITEQVLNRSIKDVCRDAKINKALTISVNSGGEYKDKIFQKHQLITSHTASKTFISLAPDWFGLTPAEVASIVGKDLKTLLNHYYDLPRESAIKKMRK